KTGRKPSRTPDEIEAAIRQVPQLARQTLRSLAIASGVPKTSLFRHKKSTPRFKARSNYIKAFLTPENVEARLQYAMSFVRPLLDGRHCFANMYDYVHVEEKWFYLTKVKRRYYVYDDEEVAARSVKPRFDHHSKKQWDGKLGVWPFVHVSPAARASKNRPKGTLLTVPLAVDAKVYSDAIMDKVVPSIQLKFPGDWRRKQVLIQQDNASPHRRVTSEFLQQQGIFYSWNRSRQPTPE
ncbi:hypothetical protein AaE_013403, partial [Aphanomyces astaci]